MSDFDVKEKRFEEDIEDYLTHHGGYTKGDPKKFNRESGLEEDTFVEFIKTSQPKKWERYVKIYAENSEKQIIERFKREVKTDRYEQNDQFFRKLFDDPDMMRQVMETVGSVLYERLKKKYIFDPKSGVIEEATPETYVEDTYLTKK